MKRWGDEADTGSHRRGRSQWADLHPDVDTTSIDVIGRVLRAAAVLRMRLDVTIAEAGLNRPSSTCCARCAAAGWR
ncbi:hypothetical protein [Saccharopolyspora gregorii]|uniref:Uncharacterized protein n=1 Tax=Saccharopolyspora gregorii TaxID=33914 RepID=A0ABP6RIB3_9PSEU